MYTFNTRRTAMDLIDYKNLGGILNKVMSDKITRTWGIQVKFLTTREKCNDKGKTLYELFPSLRELGPPPRGPFALDLQKLRQDFLKLQTNNHPDLQPIEQKDQAMQESSHINKAYETLRDPILRAQYLLSLRQKDNAENSEMTQTHDMEMLTDVLTAQEALEAAKASHEVAQLRHENTERIKSSIDKLAELFAHDDLNNAQKEINRLKYWTSLQSSLDEWEYNKSSVDETND